MKTIKYCLLLFIFLLQACSTTLHKGAPFSTLEEPKANTALIYVYRVGIPPYWRSPEMSFNGVDKATVVNETFTYFELEPNQYEIETSWPLDLGFLDQKTSYKFEAGKRYFLKLDGSMSVLGFQNNVLITSSSSRIVLMSEEDALPEIRQSMFIAPIVAK